MDSKDPKMSPEKYAEMIRKVKKRRDESQGRTMPEPVGKWLESHGIDADTLLRLEPLLRKYEGLTEEEKARFEELKDFEPNPGKATLNQIGETKTYVAGYLRGLPIYQEDMDMIKKSQPLAKKIVELQKKNQDPVEAVEEKPLSKMTIQERLGCWNLKEEKEKETMRTLRDTIDEAYNIKPEELNMGPDTTENIQEIGDNYPGAGDWKQWREEHADVLEPRDSGDVMFRKVEDLVDLQHSTQGRQTIDDKTYPSKEAVDREIEKSNKNVSQHEDELMKGIAPLDYYKYSTILKRMDDTHTRKNNDYGDAAYQGYKKYGDYYFMVQLHNKFSRLESLTVENKTQMVKDESIDDTLLDMANYAIMFLESRHRND